MSAQILEPHIIYMLIFHDNSKYIGMTTNLNRRLSSHTRRFSKKKLKIKNVVTVASVKTLKQARLVEALCIELYKDDNIHNITVNFLKQPIPEEELKDIILYEPFNYPVNIPTI